MQALFTLTRDQFIKANFQLGARPRRFLAALSTVFLLVLTGLFAAYQPLHTAIAFFIVAIGACIIGFFIVGPNRMKSRFGKIYDGIESLHVPVRCTFGAEGVTMESAKGRLRLDFSKLHKIVESRDFIFLYTAPAMAQLLPKASLDKDHLALLRESAVSHATA